MNFLVEVSARHVHVSKSDLEVLFGKGYELTKSVDLSQPNQFLSKEKVTIKNGDRSLQNVSILGPCRNQSQVEVSKTDTIALRAQSEIRDSGNLDGTPGVTLVGPCGEVELKSGLIVAQRHIHMTCEDAKKFGVVDKQIVCVEVETSARKLIFGDVLIRVSDSFALAMHIDTDEANAANIAKTGTTGKICHCK